MSHVREGQAARSGDVIKIRTRTSPALSVRQGPFGDRAHGQHAGELRHRPERDALLRR